MYANFAFWLSFWGISSPDPLLRGLATGPHWGTSIPQENVRNCTLISHFASASGGLRPLDPLPELCPWTPLGDGTGPATHRVNPLHCKILGTPTHNKTQVNGHTCWSMGLTVMVSAELSHSISCLSSPATSAGAPAAAVEAARRLRL